MEENTIDLRLPEWLFATERFSRLNPVETMAVSVEGVVEEAVDTTVEAVVVVEAVVEDVSMDTMVVVGGGGCRIFIHKTLNIRPHPRDLHPQNLDSCVHIFQCP
ncbi:hypothetical protein F2Q70_00010219 [Brassica cretica]|uniref:Uncharacterized protein n=1 Tax=Brassica cretica TaxID=69181 RepID=A0A8S9M9D0_BRACR|nr:hypothetical protein F2Q70_00010219 [Brassica cretica]